MKNPNITFRLAISFGIMVLLAFLISLVGLVYVNTIWEYTDGIYNHPLQVSNTVRDIQTHITAIHRTMKDVVLSETNEELESLQQVVAEEETEVFKGFKVLFERFLGDMDDINVAYEAFIAWEPIRSEVIELYKQGEREVAAAITKGKGADHVNYMTAAMDEMARFAEAKANEFYSEAEQSRTVLYTIMIIAMASVCIMAGVMAFVIFRTTIKPIRDMRDNLQLLLDVTQKQNQEIHRLEEERFNSVIESMPFPAMVHDRAGNINVYSDHWKEISDMDIPLTTIDEWIQGSFPALDKKKIEDIHRGFILPEGFNADAKDIIIPSRAGIPRNWNVMTASLGKDAGGNDLLFTTAFDTTRQKQDAIKIAAEREKLSVTLRSIGDGVITTDMDGKVLILNRVAEELTGWKQSEAAGQPLDEVFHIIHEDSRERHFNPFERIKKTGQIIELENHTILIAKDGTERIIADSGAPIRDMRSQIIGTVLVFRDETEKRLLQRQSQRNEKLESLGVLAGGLAHDFNNILTGLFGYIELAQAINTDKKIDEFLGHSTEAFHRAKGITAQLLTFSKGGDPIRKIEHVGDVVENSAAFVLTGSNILLDIILEPDLGLCMVDRNQLGQVIDNLVINARQAMPDGGTLSIHLYNSIHEGTESTLPGEYVTIEITDTGIGMNQDMIGNIFDPFYTTKQAGNGLGLATCFSIIKRHDGFIEVASIPGKGSTFKVFLPRAVDDGESHPMKGASVHLGKGNILILDDEKAILEVVTNMAESMGYTVYTTQSGKSAEEKALALKEEGVSLELALLDLTIPGELGGVEVRGPLSEIHPGCIMIAASGYSNNPVISDPISHQFDGSLQKPFRYHELSALLKKYLGNKK